MTTKDFPTGAVLSVYTGKMVSENHMEGIYLVLKHMTGESVFTHQIPRICREAKPVLLALHPTLALTDTEAEEITEENWMEWLKTWKARYGDVMAVPVMTIAQHERIDPRSELAEKIHPDKIIEI